MKKAKTAVVIAVAVAVIIAADIVVSNFVLCAKKYEISSGTAPDVRIAFASDIHIGDGGIAPSRIIRKISDGNPDIICLAGDIAGGDGTQTPDGFFAFLESLAEIAPVYFSLGNHELDIIKNGHGSLISDIEKCGVRVLDETYEDITVNGTAFRLGGMLDDVYHFYYTQKTFSQSPRARFLEEFNDTEKYTVMLCHRSDSYNNYQSYGVKIADLMLSGHTHGGLIRVPFGKAVYVPDLGWFPELSYGDIKKDGTEIIVTSGTARHGRLLRFNNPCEICFIDLKGERQ